MDNEECFSSTNEPESPLEYIGNGWSHSNTINHAIDPMGPQKRHCPAEPGKLLFLFIAQHLQQLTMKLC